MDHLTEEFIARKLLAASGEVYAEVNLPEAASLRCAAVLIPLTLIQNEWHILYTRRTDKVESHKGQVAFPGGACDEGETTPEQTALREAHEEIGMKPGDVTVLGRLHKMITISHFEVTPVVGVVPFPYTYRIETAEVARVFTIPLRWLADRNNYWEFSMGARRSLIAYHPYDGDLLWGATARMTVQFLRAIQLLQED